MKLEFLPLQADTAGQPTLRMACSVLRCAVCISKLPVSAHNALAHMSCNASENERLTPDAYMSHTLHVVHERLTLL